MNERLIIHVDMDAFYTSVEQRDRPALRGRPVMVGGASRRGVVAAASYEAREYGVASAMPARVARQLCPEGVFVRARMDRYREASEAIFDIFHEYGSAVEGLSLDEAYLDASDLGLSQASHIENLGRQLKRHIHSATGLTASVGLAHNKLLAKIASDYDKPDGLVYLAPHMVERTLNPLPIRRLPGVGPATAHKLQAMGILTMAQLQATDPGLLADALGEGATSLINKAKGIDHRAVNRQRDRQSVSQETTFEENITSIEALMPHIHAQAQKVAERLLKQGLSARGVHIKLRSGGFSTITRASALADDSTEPEAFVEAALGLVTEWAKWRSQFALRLFGLGVSVTRPGQKAIG
ncbi:MAG: DNA polymerase IV [Wenzhouxiangella sp.]|nr:DNA polymerase IV [Wenzhouxiangella sp.]MDR9453482.1 DNA polymerase IV [Wenzhouxiangella sp.]